jgi:hypothetical protein
LISKKLKAMEGGYYYNAYKLILDLAEDIEYELKNDFKEIKVSFPDGKEETSKIDYLNCRVRTHRKPIKSEISDIIDLLKVASDKVKLLDNFMSNNITSDEYLDIIKNNE